MPLHPVNPQRTGQAAASSNFDHIAKLMRVGGFTNNTQIRPMIMLPHPIDHFNRAKLGIAFFITGDDQAD